MLNYENFDLHGKFFYCILGSWKQRFSARFITRTVRHMNVGIGTVAAQFLSWEYVFPIFGIVSLQCGIPKGC
jgi:hypothetical protein